MKRILLSLVLTSAVAVPAVAWAEPGDPSEPGAGRRDGRGRLERVLERRGHRRQALRLLRSLDLTEAQRQGIRDARQATEEVRKALRAEVRAIVVEARKGERTPETRATAKEKVKAAIAAAVAKVEPQAKAILDSLTSDQRAKLLEAAAKRGGTATDADLVKRISKLLLAPRPHGGRGAR